MKTDIHPDYVECKVHCSCGNEFTTRSTVPTLRVELCSECHPFYTGKQKLVDTGGRVERFERRYAKAKKPPAEDGRSRRATRRPRRAPLHGRPGGGRGRDDARRAHVGGRRAHARRRDRGRRPRRARLGASTSRKIPLVRGVMALGESLALGYQGAHVVGEPADPRRGADLREGDGLDRSASRSSFFTAIFIVLPALAAQRARRLLRRRRLLVPRRRGRRCASRIFLGYLLLIGRIKDIKRVFQYHGAEHKAIAAYENDVELTPESAQQFTTAHVRCGTNFLLTVMVVAIVVYSFIGRPALAAAHRCRRIVLIPLIAGLSYEVIRFAAKHMDRRWVRVLDAARACCSSSSRPASPTSTSSRSRSRRCGRCSPPSSSPRSTPGRVAWPPPGRSASRARQRLISPPFRRGWCAVVAHEPRQMDVAPSHSPDVATRESGSGSVRS